MTSAVAIAIATIQTKHKSKMLSVQGIIKKSLLLGKSSPTNPPSNPDVMRKIHPGADSLSKLITEKGNQADLGYFDPYLNKAYGQVEIVLVGRDVYYKIVVLFI